MNCRRAATYPIPENASWVIDELNLNPIYPNAMARYVSLPFFAIASRFID